MIQKEKIQKPDGTVEDRYNACRAVIAAAEKGNVEIAVSGLCLAEVVKNPAIAATPTDDVAKYFEGDHILIVPVDRVVGTRARELIRKQAALRGTQHVPKPQDAIHIATALVSNADEMHTFDDNILSLDGKLIKDDGKALKICKPSSWASGGLFAASSAVRP